MFLSFSVTAQVTENDLPSIIAEQKGSASQSGFSLTKLATKLAILVSEAFNYVSTKTNSTQKMALSVRI